MAEDSNKNQDFDANAAAFIIMAGLVYGVYKMFTGGSGTPQAIRTVSRYDVSYCVEDFFNLQSISDDLVGLIAYNFTPSFFNSFKRDRIEGCLRHRVFGINHRIQQLFKSYQQPAVDVSDNHTNKRRTCKNVWN